MLALSDEIPLLVRRASAVHERDGDQVLTEVAGRRVDEETLPVWSADRDAAEGTLGRLVALVRLRRRRRLQSTASPRHRDRVGGIHRKDSPSRSVGGSAPASASRCGSGRGRLGRPVALVLGSGSSGCGLRGRNGDSSSALGAG